MALTPQTIQSPISPFEHEPKHPFDTHKTCYPSTPQSEPSDMDQSAHGLGIYECSMSPQQRTFHDLPPSPQPSEDWSRHSAMVDHDFYSQHPDAPNITTAAFDPFSGFDTAADSMMSTSEEAPGLVYCHTPPSSNMPSHRSSISSSCSPSPEHAEFYTPRVKSEDIHEWYSSPTNDQVLQRSLTSQSFSPYPITTLHSTGDDMYKSPVNDWSKGGPAPYGMPFNPMLGEDSRTRFDAAPVLPSANRPKKKRQRTTIEEATHDCRICGKLFKRSYNWKSHMETHNPDRKYPHPCTATVDGQQCAKKFQRKTDLDRHFESVHLKARNHRCNLCGHRFARRDTLRRHTEDGCPKRFDLGLRDQSQRWGAPARSHTTPIGAPAMQQQLPQFPGSMSHPGSTQTVSQPYFGQSPLQGPPSIFAQ